MKKLVLSKSNIIAYSLITLSAGIIFTTIYLLLNVKVLEDWKLTITTSEVHVGDTVVLESTYNKVRNASGESIRYITCKNSNGVWIRYELNRATSDRAKGRGGTGIPLVIRRDIADLPTTCRFEIAIHYDGVLPFKTVDVYNKTQTFQLLPETEQVNLVDESETQATTRSSQSQVQPVVRSGSYLNTTSQRSPSQSNNLQPGQTVQPQPTTTTNTTNTSTTNTPTVVAPMQSCTVSLLGINVLCL